LACSQFFFLARPRLVSLPLLAKTSPQMTVSIPSWFFSVATQRPLCSAQRFFPNLRSLTNCFSFPESVRYLSPLAPVDLLFLLISTPLAFLFRKSRILSDGWVNRESARKSRTPFVTFLMSSLQVSFLCFARDHNCPSNNLQGLIDLSFSSSLFLMLPSLSSQDF